MSVKGQMQATVLFPNDQKLQIKIKVCCAVQVIPLMAFDLASSFPVLFQHLTTGCRQRAFTARNAGIDHQHRCMTIDAPCGSSR